MRSSHRQDQTLTELLEKIRNCDADRRSAVLDDVCGDDLARRIQLEALLRSKVEVRVPSSLTNSKPGAEPTAGDRIGRYKIERLIGRGGMGVVFEACQTTPIQRQVALKLINTELSSGDSVRRFDNERQALALLSHPNIARVFDAAATADGRPFFVMELIEGPSITEFCESNRLGVHDRIELFLGVCDAVEHAHQKGILHRDIKPTNILVTGSRECPEPKVIDFGLARIANVTGGHRAFQTASDAIIGTWEYMSPEQARSNQDVDTRSDVFSMGVVLYELLVGAIPHDTRDYETLFEYALALRDREPIPPSAAVMKRSKSSGSDCSFNCSVARLSHALRGDIDSLVMKALDRERDRRYASISDLRNDLHRILTHRPIKAGPPSAVYRARKFVRRHRMAVGAASAIVLGCLISVGGLALGYVQARASLQTAKEEHKNTRDMNIFLSDLLHQASIDQRDFQVISKVIGDATHRLAQEETVLPAAKADILRSLGTTYCSKGAYAKGRDLLQAAYDTCRALYGPEPHPTLCAASDLALASCQVGDFAMSERLGRKTLSIAEQKLGLDHPTTLTAMNNLALALGRQGKSDEAQAQYEAVIERRLRVLGPRNELTILAQSNLAGLLETTGDLAKSIPLMRSVLAAYRDVRGDDGIDTIMSASILGTMLRKNGEFDEAERLTRVAYEKLLLRFGPHEPNTLICGTSLAEVLMALERFEESEALFRQVIAATRERSGEGHFATFWPIVCLGRCLRMQGDYPSALVEFARAHEIRTTAFPDNKLDALRLALEVAETHALAGNTQVARTSLDDIKRQFGLLDVDGRMRSYLQSRIDNVESALAPRVTAALQPSRSTDQ